MKYISTIEAIPYGYALCGVLKFKYKNKLAIPRDWIHVEHNIFDSMVYSTGIPSSAYHTIYSTPTRELYTYVGNDIVYFNINPHFRMAEEYTKSFNAILTDICDMFGRDNELSGLRYSKIVYKILDDDVHKIIASRFSPKLARYVMDWNGKRLFLYKARDGFAVENVGNGERFVSFIGDVKEGRNCVFH